jgi:hypothetical protein
MRAPLKDTSGGRAPCERTFGSSQPADRHGFERHSPVLTQVGTQSQHSLAPPFGPAQGSQSGAQAGRHALEGQVKLLDAARLLVHVTGRQSNPSLQRLGAALDSNSEYVRSSTTPLPFSTR